MRVTQPQRTTEPTDDHPATPAVRNNRKYLKTVCRSPASHQRNRRSATCLRRRGLVARVLMWAVLAAVLLSMTAADSTQPAAAVVAAQQVTTISDVFNNIRNWLIAILASLATVFLTIAGVRYLMASGDPGEVEKAKQAFRSAGKGYALAALAPVIVEILKGIVGV